MGLSVSIRISRFLTLVSLSLIPIFGLPAVSNAGIVGPDSAGYIADDSATFAFQDISGTGVNVNAGDETTHGPFPLGFSFRFYGVSHSQVYFSSNGWLSFSDPGVPGSPDASNDCPVPSANGQDNLIAGIWDDLDPTAPGGGVFYQAFGVGDCPYESYPGACFIVQWNNVVHFANAEGNGTDDLIFEIILFDNEEILVQIQDAGDEAGSSSTTGIENSDASIGLAYACGAAVSIQNNTAILFRLEPTIFYVNDDASGAGDGSSWTDAFTDLQDAFAVAGFGEQIWVAEGVYTPGVNEASAFQLMDGVGVFGGFESEPGMEGNFSFRDPDKFLTILSGDIGADDTTDPTTGVVTDTSNIVGQNSDHVVRGSGTNPTAVLDGFTITSGQADALFPNDSGGGMYIVTGSPTLANLTFIGNSAATGGGMTNLVNSDPRLTNVSFLSNSTTIGAGGGMLNSASDPTLTNCAFSGNSATGNGGGMRNTSSDPTLTNCTFAGNSVADGSGGGMDNFQSSPTLTHVTFSGNSSTSLGGGMHNRESSLSLTHVTFAGNMAGTWGGGIYNGSSSSLRLTNTLFTGNSAGFRGGGMNNGSGFPTLTNVTFSGNSATVGGGGLNIESATALIIQNSVFWGNSAGMEGNQISGGSQDDVTISNSLIEGSGGSGAGWDMDLGVDGGGNIDNDPLFLDADGPDNNVGTLDDDLRLSGGSPAIGAGDNDADLDGNGPGTTTISDIPTDLQGNPRIVGESIDLGPFEFEPPPDIIYVNDDAGGANNGLNWNDAYSDLQDALFISIPGTQIWMAEGVYVPGVAESDTFQLKNDVEIYGGFEGLPDTEDDFSVRDPEAFLTILSGDIEGNDVTGAKAVVTDPSDIVGANSDHVVAGSEVDETALLDGFTITAGQADAEDFEGMLGGGMFVFQGAPTLTNLIFSGNSAAIGGGMVITNDSHPKLTNVLFFRNSATVATGGGVTNAARSNPTFLDCSFLGNSAVVEGGGMFNFNDSAPSLTNVIFVGNDAPFGGGMFNDSGTRPVLTNVTFSGNAAVNHGGGMYNDQDGAPTIQNSIFWGNTAGLGGAGIANLNSAGDIPTIANSLVEDSSGSGPAWNTNIGIDGGGNIDADPLFFDPDGADDTLGTLDDNVRLSMDSLAINSGSNTADLDASGPGTTTISDILFDLDGLFRIADGTVDMGPYEFGSMGPSPTPTLTSTSTQTPTPSDTPLATDTPAVTSTATATATIPSTPTQTATDTSAPTSTTIFIDRTPTPTPTSEPEPTATRDYDAQPPPAGNGEIDVQDLMHWFEQIKNGMEDGDLLFDFSRFWQTDGK